MRYILGNIPEPRCNVKDTYGNHCPGEPKHKVAHRGKESWLCDLCYKAWLDGAFNKRKRIISPLFCTFDEEV